MSLAMRKAIAECEAGNGLKSLNDALKKISATLTASLDIESIKALTVSIMNNNSAVTWLLQSKKVKLPHVITSVKQSQTYVVRVRFTDAILNQGKINWTSKEELDAPVAVLKYFTRFNVLQTIAKAFEKVGKDAIGKEAIQSEIHKLVVHVVQDGAQTGNFAVSWQVEKKDKELHVTVGRDWPSHAKDSNNGYPAEDALAKLIEGCL